MRINFASILLVSFYPAVVEGAVALLPCVEGFTVDCVIDLGSSCADAVVTYDFADPSECCMALTDTDGGGCNLTISPAEGAGGSPGCSYATRLNGCSAGDSMGESYCVPNTITSISFENWEGDCPASSYELKTSSESGLVLPLQLTLVGAADTWTTEAAEEWATITTEYTSTFFKVFPDLGYEDVINYIDIFSGETLIDTSNNYVTLFFMQEITWRTDKPNVTASEVIAEVFNTENGKSGYLNALQSGSENTVGQITDTFPIQVLEAIEETPPPSTTELQETEEVDAPPGGAGASASQTHETATKAPTSAPEPEGVGVTVTTGGGEAVPSPAPETSSGASLGLATGAITLVAFAILVW